ncbi:hypothetical protein R84B8_01934 [Treponema sp. R8-4-B8]
MKRITSFTLCFFVLFTLFFVSCEDPDPDPNNPIDISKWFTDDPATSPDGGTYVKFNNNNNAFAVSLYSDSARYVEIVEVPAGSQSDPIPFAPNTSGAQFYPTYQIELEDLSLPYEGAGFISRVDQNKITTLTVPSLKDISDKNPDTQLTSNAYIKIQNNGTSSLTLRKGNSEVFLEGIDSTILNGGETGLYKITPGTVSGYSLRKNTVDPVDFPSSVTEFSAARVYIFNFNGSALTLLSQTALTLGEAGKVAVPNGGNNNGGNNGDGTESSPIQLNSNTWVNGEITSDKRNVWYSINVINGTYYYIWWNDSDSGNSTKTADVVVSAYYSNGTRIFEAVDSGYSTSQSFRASSSGVVKIKVNGYTFNNGSSSTGTFGIAYNSTGTRPTVPVTYTVSFNSNNGTGTIPSSTGASGTIITLPSGNGLIRSGFIFSGWNTNSSGTGTNYAAGSSYTISNSNVTLYAKWITQVTVTFDLNGGSGTVPTSQTVNSGFNIQIPDGSGLTRDGYAFSGWNTSSAGTGTNYVAGASSYAPSSNVTLYAKWNPEYTVYFDVNDGKGTVLPPQKAYSGDSINLPSVTEPRYGFTFDGWNTNSAGTGTNYPGATYTVTANITLYARWSTSYSTSNALLLTANEWLDGNILTGNTHYKINVISGTIYNIWLNESSNSNGKTANISVANAIYTNENNDDIANVSGFSVETAWGTPKSFTADRDGIVRLRVIYSTAGTYAIAYNTTGTRPDVPVIVKFDVNGTNSEPVTGGTPSERIANSGSEITLPSGDGFFRNGYEFGGWITSASSTGDPYAAGSYYTVSSTSTITLYAKWNKVYTVTFNINGGSGTVPPSQTVNSGTIIQMPDGSGLSKDGYEFGGWNTSSAGSGTNYSVGYSYTVSSTSTSPITFYAKWNQVFTVTFNINGGSGNIPTQSPQASGSRITLPSGSGLSKSGYTFGGWSTSSAGAGTGTDNYAAGATYTISGNVTLYALWYTSSTQANPIPLTKQVWTDGNINTANSISVWYSFEVTNGYTYYIWWNDSKNGNSTKTTDVEVSAYYGNGSMIFEDKDSGYTTPQSFKADSTGTVKLKVATYSGSGTFAVVFTESTSVRP